MEIKFDLYRQEPTENEKTEIIKKISEFISENNLTSKEDKNYTIIAPGLGASIKKEGNTIIIKDYEILDGMPVSQ